MVVPAVPYRELQKLCKQHGVGPCNASAAAPRSRLEAKLGNNGGEWGKKSDANVSSVKSRVKAALLRKYTTAPKKKKPGDDDPGCRSFALKQRGGTCYLAAATLKKIRLHEQRRRSRDDLHLGRSPYEREAEPHDRHVNSATHGDCHARSVPKVDLVARTVKGHASRQSGASDGSDARRCPWYARRHERRHERRR